MSETEGSSALDTEAEQTEAESGDLEDRVSETATPEKTDSVYSHNRKTEYNRREDASKDAEKAEADSEEKRDLEEEGKDKLDARLRNSDVKAQIRELLRRELSNDGVSDLETDARELPNYKNYIHNWKTDLKSYREMIKRYEGFHLGHVLEEAFYVFMGVTDIERNVDPYEQIDKGARVIFIPGWLQVPNNIDVLQEHSGVKMAYCRTNDVDEIKRLADYAASKHGSVILVGFSDGEKTLRMVQDKYGGELQRKVDKYVCIAGNRVNRIEFLNVVGEFDFLAPLENGYEGHFDKTGFRKGTTVIKGVGHAGSMYNPESAKQIGAILNSIQSPRAYNLVRMTPDMPPVMKMNTSLN
jgi:hypothetical protein